jgi:hypothetical protein
MALLVNVNGRWVPEDSQEAQFYIQGKQREADARKLAEEQRKSGMVMDLARMADPFAPQRGQYQGQLSDLMRDPNTAVQNNPFLKAQMEAGTEAANRKLYQMGMGSSGNAALELQKHGMSQMGDSFFKLADLLGGFSGAKADPSAGASAALGAMGLQEKQRQHDIDYKYKTTPQVAGWSGYGQAAYQKPTDFSMSGYWGG